MAERPPVRVLAARPGRLRRGEQQGQKPSSSDRLDIAVATREASCGCPWPPSSLASWVLCEHITLPILTETALSLGGVALTRTRHAKADQAESSAGQQPDL
jgi:hypothetical protein